MSFHAVRKRMTWRLAFVLIPLVLLACGSGDSHRDWPDRVYFKGNTESMNGRYYALVRDGGIWVKPNVERTGEDGPWRRLTGLPERLDGQVTEIAMDDEHILALDRAREVYTMWSALDPIEFFHWQKEWGLPFWRGPGMSLTTDLLRWDFSVVSQREDGTYTDPAGNLHRVGAAKCSHIIMLTGGGRTITFNDPWLPRDLSYEIGTPFRGRFVSVGLSSSGSTHFIVNRFGDMFTRMFDFDISGLDDLFLRYSYEDQRGVRRPAIQIPAEPWRKQPKIVTGGRALITDRISIEKTGTNCVHRTLRVEGRDARGHTGYYEKDLPEVASSAWTFHRTNEALRGRVLENKHYDSAAETLGESEDLRYAMNAEAPAATGLPGFSAEIPDFNCYNSPAVLKVHLPDGNDIDLALHYLDTVRVVPRGRGIDQSPRRLAGAIEVAQGLIDHLPTAPQTVRDFIHTYLEIEDGGRFTDARLVATSNELTIEGSAFSWVFRSAPN